MSKTLSPERIQDIVGRDQPNLTATGGQTVASIGPTRISTKTVTVNGTQYNETAAVVHVTAQHIMDALVSEGAKGFWAHCAAAAMPSNANNVSRVTKLVAGESKQVGAVYSGNQGNESWVVTGISDRSIRLVPTTANAELGPMGILVESHPREARDAIVRVRGPVESGASGSGLFAALGCCGGASTGEKLLLRQLDSCDANGKSTSGGVMNAVRMQMAMGAAGMDASQAKTLKVLSDEAEDESTGTSNGNSTGGVMNAFKVQMAMRAPGMDINQANTVKALSQETDDV